MARRLKKRLKVTGTLLAQSPLHIGGLGASADVDLTLAVNGSGDYYVPGTSLAGALRGWLKESSARIDALWGYQQDSGEQETGHASYVVVEDAAIGSSDNRAAAPIAEVRDGVGIDRYYGSAAETIKFNRAILPKGTRIPLSLTFEQGGSDEDWAEARCLFANTLYALQAGAIRLGAAKTRGLGKVALVELSIVEQDLSSFEGMLKTLSGEGSAISLPDMVPANYRWHLPQQLEITIGWNPVGPVMVKAEAAGIAVDMLPLVSHDDQQPCFVIPGSAIKGALRSQAERIIRTLLAKEISTHSDPKQRFLEQLNDIPIVDRLFGQGAKQQGALAVDDCYARQKITADQWLDIETATDENRLQSALAAADLTHVQQAFHVAIDRWTGGAAESQLYSTLELMDVKWASICLTVDLTRLESADDWDTPVAIALIVLLLRDLAQGRIPLGYGTNRGMGAIAIQSVDFERRSHRVEQTHSEPSAQNWSALETTPLFDSDMTLQDSPALQQLNHHWQQWLTARRTAA